MRAFANVGVASSLDYRLIDDSSECNFLDNRCEWPIKICDLPIMSARPRGVQKIMGYSKNNL
jgi:hypothetical protein